VVVGLVVAAVGLVVALWPSRPSERTTAGAADP
jgi:hypothetical protein